jgi:hypothetical protein
LLINTFSPSVEVWSLLAFTVLYTSCGSVSGAPKHSPSTATSSCSLYY